jgi:transcriptional regulator with XRE-family HTH domain
MKLGSAIKKVRTDRGISLDQLSNAIGCDKPYLVNLESNRINVTASKYLDKICDILGTPIPMIYLLSLEVEDAPEEKRVEARIVLDNLNETYLDLFSTKSKI